MKRSAIALSAILALSASAHAADLGWSSAPAASPIYSATPASGWGGFYAGINGGYTWGTTSTNPAIMGAVDNNSSGWTLGGQLGYNYDMGGFVIGGEADLQWANIAYGAPAGVFGDFKASTDVFGTARIRAGAAFGQVMPYATLGAAFGRGTATLTNNQNVVTSQSANHIGWTAGVGLEAQATPNLSFKAEYLYVDLGKQSYNGLPVGNVEVTQRFSVIRAGVNYKF
ncbi:MAG: porin family protein [Devosia sp.]|jgi:outer membrane immunogenic protein|uniref:outer membrane protein n=1 Tax=unclassified Devosia TaxID=196773 RepID=UPI0019E1AA9E|nr:MULTISPECIES: outer membrane protein [unclassified Devosia]MBF0680415.1 porin family protein [Devosia sp.]WEJ32883.1 porin family protein [Devosia sp. SD17-2]